MPYLPHLLRISYASLATRPRDAAGFHDIARAAARRNPPMGVTGALLFDGEAFLHLIEGPAPAVRDLFRVCAADPRHHAIDGLVESRDATRRFPHWRSRGVAALAPGALAAGGDAERCALIDRLIAA